MAANPRSVLPADDPDQFTGDPTPWHKRSELLLAAALGCLYLALMSGHPHSIDGLVIYREAKSLAYERSLIFTPPLRWGGMITTSKYGIGLTLLYLPGLIVWSWLRPYIPAPQNQQYDWGLFYADPLYTLVAAPVHALITAATAYLVGRCCRALGLDRGVALWAMIIYGVGSPALVYARGDWNQPLTGLCWIGACYATLRYRQSGAPRALAFAAGAVGYAVLTRPVEGALLLPAILLLLSAKTTVWRAYVAILAGFAIGVTLTLAVNAARYGTPLVTGYGDEGWTNPLIIGLRGILVSPGRGIIWAFPATLLAPLGLWHLWRSGHWQATMALGGLVAAQALNVALWHSWWGGWNWGARLLVPPLPLIAMLCAVGLTRFQARWRGPLAAALVILGTFWALPGVFTNLFGGYAGAFDGTDASFQLRAYPPFGAWTFLQHWRASTLSDASAVDILWLRTARSTGNLSLIPPTFLLALGCFLAFRALRTHLDVSAPTSHGTTRQSVPPGAVSGRAAAQ